MSSFTEPVSNVFPHEQITVDTLYSGCIPAFINLAPLALNHLEQNILAEVVQKIRTCTSCANFFSEPSYKTDALHDPFMSAVYATDRFYDT